MTTTWNPEAGRPGVLVGVAQRHAGRTAAKNAAFFLPHLKPGMSVLDVGCGPGTITVGLAEAVAPGLTIGLDIDHEQIDKAVALGEARGIANLRFNMGDIYHLPFADETFDAVFAHTVFMHLKDPLAAAREVLRVLKPGGVFGVSERMGQGSVHGGLTPLLVRFGDIYDAWARRRGVDLWMGPKLPRLLCDAGFERVEPSASYGHIYGTIESKREFAQMLIKVVRDSTLPGFAEEAKLADRATIEQMAAEWEIWVTAPDSFHFSANGEAVGWKPDDLL